MGNFQNKFARQWMVRGVVIVTLLAAAGCQGAQKRAGEQDRRREAEARKSYEEFSGEKGTEPGKGKLRAEFSAADQAWLKKLRDLGSGPDHLSGRFDLKGRVGREKINVIGDLWARNDRGKIKILLSDPLFESKVNTILAEQGVARIYDHINRKKFAVPTRQLRVPQLMGDLLSFQSLQPLIAGQLPPILFVSAGTRRLVSAQMGRIYLRAPEMEALFDFGGEAKDRLARIIVREVSTGKRVQIRFGNWKSVAGKKLPYKMTLRDDSSGDTVSITFRWLSSKKLPDWRFRFP